jgi:hypothetical protein
MLISEGPWSREAWFVILFIVAIVLIGGLMGLIVSLRERDKAATNFLERSDKLAGAARKQLQDSFIYQVNHVTAGRHVYLLRRLASLGKAMSRLDAIKQAQNSLPEPLAPVDQNEDRDSFAMFRAAVEKRLLETPRERWVVEILREPDPGSRSRQLDYRNGSSKAAIQQAVFLQPLDEISFEQLVRPPGRRPLHGSDAVTRVKAVNLSDWRATFEFRPVTFIILLIVAIVLAVLIVVPLLAGLTGLRVDIWLQCCSLRCWQPAHWASAVRRGGGRPLCPASFWASLSCWSRQGPSPTRSASSSTWSPASRG